MWKEYNYKGSLYLVDEKGTIISKATNKIIQPRKNYDGYLVVTLGSSKSRNRPQTRSTAFVHKIVALCFVPNPNPNVLTEINHKDFNRENCCAENLEWVSHRDNVYYSIDSKRYWFQTHSCEGQNNFNAKLTKTQVKEIRKKAKSGISTYRLAKEYNRGWTTIKHIIDYDTWKNI